MATKQQRVLRVRLASGPEVAQFYARKAGVHDPRAKRLRTRQAVLRAALRDYR